MALATARWAAPGLAAAPWRRWLTVSLLVAIGLPMPGAKAIPAGGLPSAGETLSVVRPVEAVDLARYAGGWYEIARIPNRFQRQCARHTIAHYGLRPDGRLSVLNQCIKRSGNVDQATGVATVVDPVSRARLKVSLVSLLGWRPFWGDYWVIGLDTAYRWAVVGSPDRRYGWVLARAPRLDDASMAKIREILDRNGYDWASFALSE